VGAGNFCSVHVSLVPVLGVVGEQKTKPTQHSVAVLRSLGINPHLLACRSSEPLEQAVKVKLVSPCPSFAACVACQCWAARYNTWLLVKLTPKAVVFSFLFSVLRGISAL